jgi:beta-lactamase regulating signal transducer with metallopeptidase domain
MNAALWWLGQNTVAVAVMVPFVVVACRLFRRRPAVQHVLWLVVLLKFVTPPVVAWPWTIDHVRNAVWPSPTPVVAATGAGEPDAVLPDADTSLAVGDIVPASEPGLGAFAPFRAGVEPASAVAAVPARPDMLPLILGIVAGVWLLGAAVCLTVRLRRIAQHVALVRRGAAAPQLLNDEIRVVAGQLRVRPPRALVAGHILSPFVWCLGRLRLVWPEALASHAEVARSRGIIAHELAHIRRGDHWVAWLELAAGVVWWWNPLFWLTRKRLRESAEMACDALAIGTCPGRRREYAELLLELSAGFKSGMPAPVLAVSAGTPSSFERRLSMILSDRVSGKVSRWGLVAALALALAALPGWSRGQQTPAPDKPKAEDVHDFARQTTPATLGQFPVFFKGNGRTYYLDADEKGAYVGALNADGKEMWRSRISEKLPVATGGGEWRLAEPTDKKEVVLTWHRGDMTVTFYLETNTGKMLRQEVTPPERPAGQNKNTPPLNRANESDEDRLKRLEQEIQDLRRKLQKQGTSPPAQSKSQSPDGKLVLHSRGRDILVLDAATGKIIRSIQPDGATNIVGQSFSPDGKTIVVQDAQGIVSEIDLATGEILKKMQSSIRRFVDPKTGKAVGQDSGPSVPARFDGAVNKAKMDLDAAAARIDRLRAISGSAGKAEQDAAAAEFTAAQERLRGLLDRAKADLTAADTGLPAVKPRATTRDPLDLAERYLKAVADLKVARSQVASLDKRVHSNFDLEKAQIELERAAKVEQLMSAYIKDALKLAASQKAYAEQELGRLKELVNNGLVAKSEFDAAQARYEEAAINLKQLESIISVFSAPRK